MYDELITLLLRMTRTARVFTVVGIVMAVVGGIITGYDVACLLWHIMRRDK